MRRRISGGRVCLPVPSGTTPTYTVKHPSVLILPPLPRFRRHYPSRNTGPLYPRSTALSVTQFYTSSFIEIYIYKDFFFLPTLEWRWNMVFFMGYPVSKFTFLYFSFWFPLSFRFFRFGKFINYFRTVFFSPLLESHPFPGRLFLCFRSSVLFYLQFGINTNCKFYNLV